MLAMPIQTLTTGQVYNAYDEIVKKVERWIQTKSPTVWWCDSEQVQARLTQRIVELSCDAYTEFAATHANQSGSTFFFDSLNVNVGGLKVQSDTGSVALEPALWIHHVALFFATWAHLLIFLIAGLFRRSPNCSIPATLLMEAGGDYAGSDASLVGFCRQGPIDPLCVAKRILIRSPIEPTYSTDSSFFYTKHPLLHLISTQLKWSHKANLLIQHLFAPVLFFRALFACSASVLIARDLSYIPVVRWLDKQALIDAIVITTSSFTSQPLWMRSGKDQKFDLHMIWYSQNFIPKVYVGEKESSNLPSARHMHVDVHWVWTEGFKTYLKSLGQKSDIRVVGPILWYLPESNEKISDSKVKIAVFDITPLPDGHRPFGALSNYYTVNLMKVFIQDIVDVCQDIEKECGKEIVVLLKHKRAVKNGFHDSGYVDFLDEMCSLNDKFCLIDHNVNLFGLLNECAISVSVPYTSTAYVSAYLNRPAIYYDPFGELIQLFEANTFVHFISQKTELKKMIYKFIIV